MPAAAVEDPFFHSKRNCRQICQHWRWNRVIISVIIILSFYLIARSIRFLYDNDTYRHLGTTGEVHHSSHPSVLSNDEMLLEEQSKHAKISSSVFDQKSITKKRTVFNERNQHGTWIGNNWVPPAGKRIYSAADMRLFFQKHSVLWVGDSTARRAYNTLYGILSCNDTHIPMKKIDTPALIDVNKGENITEKCTKPGTLLCRTVPGTAPKDSKFFDYRKVHCYKDAAALAATEEIRKKITTDYSLLIVSLGVWETAKKDHCASNHDDRNKTATSFPNSTYQSLSNALDAMCQLQGPSLTVVWRTSGFQDKDDVGNMYLKDFNERSIGHIDSFNKANIGSSNITYVDWGEEIWPRSNGEDRIKGDIDAHYGLEARLLFLQLLMNELDALNRF
jgi:hypothetical protein